MSYGWAVLGSDRTTIFLGAEMIGLIACLLIGLPLMLLLRSYEYYLTIWFWIIFVIIVFSVVIFWSYKAGCNRLKKEK